MGLYVETVENKLSWLNNNGVLSTQKGVVKDDEFLVCWVDNQAFQAVAVAFSDEELKVLSLPDGRTKLWFIVKKDKLREVCPEWDKYVRVKGKKPEGRMREEMKKHAEIKNGIHATFEDLGNGVKVKVSVDANQEEVEALIKSMISMIAKKNGVHVAKVIEDVALQMMADDLGKDK